MRTRDVHIAEAGAPTIEATGQPTLAVVALGNSGSDRARRMRDAVEAALSDVILLGTEEQVRLAARAATELAQGRPTPTADLVVSLRDFIRRVLDLDPFPAGLSIPKQGPTRPSAARAKDGGGGKDEGKQGGDKGAGGGGGGGSGIGTGLGAGAGGLGAAHAQEDDVREP